MKWENFTAERVSGFRCKPSKQQSIYWDGKTPGLGLRVTATGNKSYIFETALNGKTIRQTIGDPRTWRISDAQAEATRLKTMTDQGIDPRQVRADDASAKEAKATSLKLLEARESVTVGKAWEEYLTARKPFWGARHYDDHEEVMHPGGEIRKRSKKLTEPGALASLAMVRLIDVTPERVTEWAKEEGEKRSGRARLANRLLKAFLSWCAEHKIYKTIVTDNAAKNKAVRELLGKPKMQDDTLQREQLQAWFTAVQQIGNPIISTYLQALLLTGARPIELNAVRWADIDFQWNKMIIRDKVEGQRVIPLTPYLGQLLAALPRRKLTVRQIKEKEINLDTNAETSLVTSKNDNGWNEYVFTSRTSVSGHLTDPHDAHTIACSIAGITLTIYGLRRSFATLSEWIEMPAGIAAQIQGHKPSGVRERHYIRRPIDLLRVWHVKIEAWILEQAGIKFV